MVELSSDAKMAPEVVGEQCIHPLKSGMGGPQLVLGIEKETIIWKNIWNGSHKYNSVHGPKGMARTVWGHNRLQAHNRSDNHKAAPF